jgi:hypothetical protein
VKAIWNYDGASVTNPPTSSALANPRDLNAWTLGELNGITFDDLPQDFDQMIYFNYAIQPDGPKNTTMGKSHLPFI